MIARIDWRKHRPAMAVRRTPEKPRGRIATSVRRIPEACRRIFQSIRAVPGGEPNNWRDAAVFLVGSAWGVMLTVGALEAWRHLS